MSCLVNIEAFQFNIPLSPSILSPCLLLKNHQRRMSEGRDHGPSPILFGRGWGDRMWWITERQIAHTHLHPPLSLCTRTPSHTPPVYLFKRLVLVSAPIKSSERLPLRRWMAIWDESDAFENVTQISIFFYHFNRMFFFFFYSSYFFRMRDFFVDTESSRN